MSANNIPTHPLPDWLSGKHDEEMRVMCAEELGRCTCSTYRKPGDWETAVCDDCGKNPFFAEHNIPNYPASLDACVQLRAAMSEGEIHHFKWQLLIVLGHPIFHLFELTGDMLVDLLNATPRQIVLAFLLTRNRVAIL